MRYFKDNYNTSKLEEINEEEYKNITSSLYTEETDVQSRVEYYNIDLNERQDMSDFFSKYLNRIKRVIWCDSTCDIYIID